MAAVCDWCLYTTAGCFNMQSNLIHLINPLKHEVHLNNIYKFSSYFKENTMRLHYKDQMVNIVQ
jgi:hypothetical protein